MADVRVVPSDHGDPAALALRRDAGSLAISLQTPGGISDEVARLWVLRLPPEEIGRIVPSLSRVTKADVRRASRRVFGTGAARVVAVGDAAAIREELATFGELVEAAEAS